MSFPFPDLYDFLRGPGLVLSITIFISGFIFRTIQLIKATGKIRKYNNIMENIAKNGNTSPAGKVINLISSFKRIRLRDTLFGRNPVMGTISLVFHILLFITPVFLSAHNTIADTAAGLSLPVFPDRLSDIFTVLLITAGGFFLARRIAVPGVRMISTVRDYGMLVLVITPFLSGLFAYHHIFDYRTVVFIHMISGEIAIMALPFTGLVHMPFIIFSRFNIDSEHSIIQGKRRW